MRKINIHDAKTHLSSLVEAASRGESFIIARAGKPLVKVVPVDQPKTLRRIGFMTGQIAIPADFDRVGEEEIAGLFGFER